MAKPIIPLEIWAYDDYILPNTKELNKERPISDLWQKGYDLGEKPAAEEHNYIFNMLSLWLTYVRDEQIPGLDSLYLKVVNNLSDVPNKVTARANLDVYSKSEAEARYVKVAGDTMSGALSLPRLNFAAADSDVAFIQATVPSADVTWFDFWIGDNPGNPSDNGVDRFRWCFQGTSSFEMMSLNAVNLTTALLLLQGRLEVRDTILTGTLNSNNINLTNKIYAPNAVFDNFTTQNNYAVVAGRHIARTVNGYGAGEDGNITLPLPQQGILDVRWSEMGSYSSPSFSAYANGRQVLAPGGAALVGLADVRTDKTWIEDVDVVWYRYLQKNVNGVWYNVAAL